MGNSMPNTATMLINIGTNTVPLARMMPAKMPPAPKNNTLHYTMCSNSPPNFTTAASVMNKAIKWSENKYANTIKLPVKYRFMLKAVKVTLERRWNWPEPIAWAAKIEAAMEIDMAGNCTKLFTWLTAP